jgi:predicted acyltransferase
MKRIASIDIFRALTMIIMIFVNDYAGMGGLPHWLHHADFDEDMLGFSDLVFPAFLFCVGMSIPFAVGARFNRGASQLQVLGHIVLRSLALLVMGIFSMNMRGVEGGLSHPVFSLLAIAGYFLIWNAYPKSGRWRVVMRIAGIILLIGLVVYKDLHGMPFRHGWWGILGLIAWAYFPCAVGYLCLRGDFRKVMVFSFLTLLLCLLNASPAIPADWSSRAVILGFWPGGWTHPAICAAGMMTSMLLIRFGDRPRNLLSCYAGFALAMFILGLVSHRFWIISKIQATPTWLFFCVAISVVCFGMLYWFVDLRCRIKSGMTKEVKSGMTKEVKSGMTKEVKPGMTNEVKSGMTKEVKSDMTKEIKPGMTKEIESGMTKEMTLNKSAIQSVIPDKRSAIRNLIAPAGTATLTCYMMPSIWYDVQQLLGLHWPAALTFGLPGLIKALVFAFIIVALTGLFEKLHLKLKI